MKKDALIIYVDQPEEINFSATEICEICGISLTLLQELIDYNIIELSHPKQRFNLETLYRIKTALRLQHDLEMNLAGVALALELLDELNQFRNRTSLLEKHFFSKP